MFFYSIKKSCKVKKLQRKISPPAKNMNDLTKILIRSFQNPKIEKARENALEAYLDLCESDPNVKQFLDDNKLTRNDLKTIYQSLKFSAGAWVKGHYVPLSTIAYVQPLKFYFELKRSKKSDIEIAFFFIEYWKRN